MKQSLDLQLGQHLTITPQLQQAIRLLQLSSIELQQEIQEALESNPLLEEKEEDVPDQKAEEPSGEFNNDAENSLPDSGTLQPTDMEMDHPDLDDGPGADSDWSDAFEVPTTSTTRASYRISGGAGPTNCSLNLRAGSTPT